MLSNTTCIIKFTKINDEGKAVVEKKFFVGEKDFDILLRFFESKGTECPECGWKKYFPGYRCDRCGYVFGPLIFVKRGDCVRVARFKREKGELVTLEVNGVHYHFGIGGLKTYE